MGQSLGTTGELFTLSMLHHCLDGFCEQWEVDRLTRFYSTYKNKRYRQGYLTAVLDGSAHMQADRFKKDMMIARAFSKKQGKTLEQLKPYELGRLAQDHAYKLRTLAIRVMFLRLLHEPGPNGVRRKLSQFRAAYDLAEELSYLPAAPDGEAIRKMCKFRFS